MLNRSLPVFALALAALLPLAAPAALAETAAPTITVTGEGMAEVTPDLATLSIGVTTTGATAAEALAANSASLAAVLEKLKAAGIEDRDIQTSNLSVS
ncbi:MAG: SIMPL domain-containing protein, partial [Tabrizicola sp.]